MTKNGFVYKKEVLVGDRKLLHYELPIRQWQQYIQSEIYKDLGDKAVEYDCAG